jgi:hypothetical protein
MRVSAGEMSSKLRCNVVRTCWQRYKGCRGSGTADITRQGNRESPRPSADIWPRSAEQHMSMSINVPVKALDGYMRMERGVKRPGRERGTDRCCACMALGLAAQRRDRGPGLGAAPLAPAWTLEQCTAKRREKELGKGNSDARGFAGRERGGSGGPNGERGIESARGKGRVLRALGAHGPHHGRGKQGAPVAAQRNGLAAGAVECWPSVLQA